MRSSFTVLAVVAVFALSGCHRGARGHGRGAADVHFTPYSVVQQEPATDAAVRFHEGDKHALSKVGAQYVGELQMDARKAGARRAERAAHEAAKVGATHYLLVEAAGSNGRFALFRVDPERWNELPNQLRPAVYAGEPTSTTTLTSAPAAPAR